MYNLSVKEEATYTYAIIRVYCSILLKSNEIYVLLREGFPEGAFASCRYLYESLALLKILLNGSSENDEELLGKFFEAADVSVYKQRKIFGEWYRQYAKSKEMMEHILCYIGQRLEAVRERSEGMLRQNKKILKLMDYWWADCASISDFFDKANLEKDGLYKRMSMFSHADAFSCLHYICDNSEIVMVGTDNGRELPLFYASLILCESLLSLAKEYPQLVSDKICNVSNQLCINIKDIMERLDVTLI